MCNADNIDENNINVNKKDLYLITGFLGAGKTTLMKELINYFSDKKIAVIVNEFGQQGVDGVLLRNKGIEVTEISNGSIFCVCRSDLFVEVLLRALKTDAEVVLVETSGLSDPTGMNEILDTVHKLSDKKAKNENTDCLLLSSQCFEIKNRIAVVDANNFLKLVNTALAVTQQIIASNLVIVNKVDLVDNSVIMQIHDRIKQINVNAGIKNTTFSKIDPSWINQINSNEKEENKKFIKKRTIGTQKITIYLDEIYKKDEIFKWINGFYRYAYRIKGFVMLEEGPHYVDCTGENISIEPCTHSNEKSFIVVLASGDSPVKSMIKEHQCLHLHQI